jgi:2-dehydropantoate 2-reductase
VTFLVRPQRAERLRTAGLQILSPAGDVSVTPQVVTADALPDEGRFDAVLLSVKAFSLEQALDDMAPAAVPAP